MPKGVSFPLLAIAVKEFSGQSLFVIDFMSSFNESTPHGYCVIHHFNPFMSLSKFLIYPYTTYNPLYILLMKVHQRLSPR